LDLRDEPLPATIKTALGARAASDLTKADFDEVLYDRRIGWLGGVAATLAFVALLLLFILRPAQFLSLIGRAFAPFSSTAIAVQNGFTYQVVGGDAATPEYRVTVRSSPLIDGFEARYHFRPYLRFADQTTTNPNLEALRGTQVALTVKTNRHVKEGWLRFH